MTAEIAEVKCIFLEKRLINKIPINSSKVSTNGVRKPKIIINSVKFPSKLFPISSAGNMIFRIKKIEIDEIRDINKDKDI
ncbi:hypothetical protein OM33_01335 [Pseudoalteromonas piratica]|uniref:Uncharacterized protein n=1 Tax=Pseudoalteromonas piratica TaxID=1348114 RepID=A0A0A7ECY6_9GAMM|nr:hypothetical protein OM33_01335 [Pseudoalteromonas piratica]